MRALQLQYTSCRRGLSGNAGFQTRALTPGIAPDEQREIERRGVYRPPRDANPEPAPEEIARDFPQALRCYVLESGRRALTRACYTGRDYSGRWGNFFSHTLVLDNGHQPSLWPIDYYEWDGWRERLPPEEDTEQPPAPLTAAELDGVTPAESFRLEELQEFLHEQPGRRDLLARMGRAVFLGQESSRAVVIRDSATNGLYWIACLQKLFPPAHSWALSCSTYQDDPRGCGAVNATTGETDFAFDDAERRFRFYTFDLTTGLHSEVPEAVDDYPAVAARWLAEGPDRLQRFFGFLRLFDHHRPEPELISALHLFELAEGQGSSLDGTRLAGMIAFAARHATSQGRIELLDLVGRAADAEGIAAETTGRALARMLAPVPAAEANAVRHLLDRPQDWEILFGEWLEIRDRAPRPLSAFEDYRRSVLGTLPGYEKHCFPRLAASLLDVLPETERISVSLAWLRNQEVERFSPEVAGKCLALANGAVPLDPSDRESDGVARLVAESASRLGLHLWPDRPRLREILATADSPHATLKDLRLDVVRASLAELRPDERALFLFLFVPAALERADTREQHRKVLVATCPPRSTRDFAGIYLDFLRAKRKSPWPEPLQAALKFWLAFDAGEEELKPLAPLEAAAHKGLAVTLARLKPERLQEVRKHIERSRPDARALARWKGIEEDCERRRRGPWERLVSVFTRKSPETRRT